MSGTELRWAFLTAWLAAVFVASQADVHASNKKAYRHVNDGIQHYRAGNFEAADRAFAEADIALPEDDRIAYDRACVFAARGDTDKAIELFRQAALSRDPQLAAGSHYNLGCAVATKAKAIFGDNPEEATPEVRTEGLPLLASAIAHYRDCLEIEPNHSGARRNLELLRLWIKHMQDTWANRDREKQRDEMDLLAFLQMIEAQQTALRGAVKQLETENDSPRRRQATKQVKTEQLRLADEIKPLKDKIQQTLQPPAAPAGQANAKPPNADQMKSALDALNEMADRARTAMQRASRRLDDRELPDAVDNQAKALDALNEIYTVIAPFQHVLQKATAAEDGLVNRSQGIVERPEEVDDEEDAPTVDYPDLAQTQRRVEGWSEVLPMKAQAELKQIEAVPSAAGPAGAVKVMPGTDPQQAERDKEALKKSLQKAVELGPKIKVLCDEAAKSLENEDADAALPKQEDALKLLKEIAESLPKEPQQNQDQDDQQKQDEQKKQPKQQPSGNDQKQQPKPKDLSRQQAEAVLRKVREREREHRERQKELGRFIQGGVVVDKDW